MNSQPKDFEARLQKLLADLEARARQQFTHNLVTNVPAGRVALEDVVDNAIEVAVAGSLNSLYSFSCDDAIRLAGAILEDANCHAEHRALLRAAKA